MKKFLWRCAAALLIACGAVVPIATTASAAPEPVPVAMQVNPFPSVYMNVPALDGVVYPYYTAFTRAQTRDILNSGVLPVIAGLPPGFYPGLAKSLINNRADILANNSCVHLWFAPNGVWNPTEKKMNNYNYWYPYAAAANQFCR